MEEGWFQRLMEAIERDGRDHKALSLAAKPPLGVNYIQQMLMHQRPPKLTTLERILTALAPGETPYVKYGTGGSAPPPERQAPNADVLLVAAPVHFDSGIPPQAIVDVPRVSWVTAGEMGDQEAVTDLSDFPTVPAADLPAGRWIALKVEHDANSMNKISPPESTIFVNLDDRRLVPNACYIISDEQGRVTYKRYRPNEHPPYQPASYDDVEPPDLEGAIRVIGRVKRSQIDM